MRMHAYSTVVQYTIDGRLIVQPESCFNSEHTMYCTLNCRKPTHPDITTMLPLNESVARYTVHINDCSDTLVHVSLLDCILVYPDEVAMKM